MVLIVSTKYYHRVFSYFCHSLNDGVSGLFSNLIHDDFARFLTEAADEKIAFFVCRANCVLGGGSHCV